MMEIKQNKLIEKAIKNDLVELIDYIVDVATYTDFQRGTMGINLTGEYFKENEQKLNAMMGYHLGMYGSSFQYWFRDFIEDFSKGKKFDYKKCQFLISDFGTDVPLIKYYSEKMKELFERLNDSELYEYIKTTPHCVKHSNERERIEKETKEEILNYFNNN